MRKWKWLVASLIAAVAPHAIVACNNDAPDSAQPEEGECYTAEGNPCNTTDGGAGTGGKNDTGGSSGEGGSNKPPIDAGGAGGTGGKDSGSGGAGGETGGSGGGDTGGSSGDGGSGGGSGCSGLEVKCSGVCKDLAHDPNNCGSCGHTCTGGTSCQSGECLPCPVGTWNCGTSCVDFKTDENNCGGCNLHCDAGETCHPQSGPPWGVCY